MPDFPLSRPRALVSLVLVLTLGVTLLGAAAESASAQSHPSAQAASAQRQHPSGSGRATPVHPYPLRTGVIFSDPLRPRRRMAIMTHLLQTIRSMRHGDMLRVSDWNIQSRSFVRTAIAAHRRGVLVRVLMSRAVALREPKRWGSYWQLRAGLRPRKVVTYTVKRHKGHKVRVRHVRWVGVGSWMRTCSSSCRGRTGIMHAKMLLADRVGTANDVVMVSSSNMTRSAGVNQWNDLFTLVGNRKIYHFFTRMFAAESRDEAWRRPYRTFTSGPITAYFNPHRKGDPDPALQDLRQVSCRHAGSSAGVRGRTAIRIAQTALVSARGLHIARQLLRLHRQGCNIKLVYTLMGSQIHDMLSGRVRLRQLTRDTNMDGYYDLYLHTKLMTISGNIGGKPNQHLVRNGSENWTPVAFMSDEAGFQLRMPWVEHRYSAWINRAFDDGANTYQPKLLDRMANMRGFARVSPADPGPVDPYKYVEVN